MTINTNQLKSGLAILLDGQLYTVVEYEHVKPGKGVAFVRTKLRSVDSGGIIDRTFRDGDKLEDVFIEERKLQFMYRTDEDCHFMDLGSYDQLVIPASKVGNAVELMKEGTEVACTFHGTDPLNVILPIFVELKVSHTEPGFRGDTARGGTKAATVESGATLQVPLFVEQGDTLKIDTRTCKYVGRV
ncbi:MAG: elongation factor P [Candidatus Omnitrophica bacterium]|nr:elongation factor P [Candidatus Omnitrophota bacterium]